MPYKKNTKCPLPWLSSSIKSNGDLRICTHTCKHTGNLTASTGEIYNIRSHSPHASRNSNEMKNIRQSMILGEEPDSCARCFGEEKNNIQSFRQILLKQYEHIFTEKFVDQTTSSDGTLNTDLSPIKYISVILGNHCNLKCRMCSPISSNQWLADHKALWKTDHFFDNGKKIYLNDDTHYAWPKSNSSWQNLISIVDNIEFVYIAGGEPLQSEEQLDFLKACVESGRSKDISIEYNTNLTYIPPAIWDLWSHFKCIKMGISIDGIGAHNNYIRHPSRWEQITYNLQRIDQMPNLEAWIAYTVQAYNIFYLPEFFRWKMTQNFNRINASIDNLIFNPHPLHHPKYLSIRVFPSGLKKIISKKLRDFYPEIPELLKIHLKNEDQRKSFQEECIRITESYISFMESEDFSNDFDKFWEVTKKLDSLRGESFEQTFPDFFKELKNYLPS